MLVLMGTMCVVAQAGDAKRGEQLFVRCSICHGFSGEKSALNKSMIINEMTRYDFIDALKGYQDGTYGRDAKKQMQMAIRKLNDVDIDDLSDYVQTLNPKR